MLYTSYLNTEVKTEALSCMVFFIFSSSVLLFTVPLFIVAVFVFAVFVVTVAGSNAIISLASFSSSPFMVYVLYAGEITYVHVVRFSMMFECNLKDTMASARIFVVLCWVNSSVILQKILHVLRKFYFFFNIIIIHCVYDQFVIVVKRSGQFCRFKTWLRFNLNKTILC
jgi:hypothetical protein